MKQILGKQLLCRTLSCALLLFLLFASFPLSAAAAEDTPAFHFTLSIDGRDTKEVRPGDVITVVLHLERTDSDAPYTMYAMQDEIRYDSKFFEFVQGGTLLSSGIQAKDSAARDGFREVYMNYLSLGGGVEWQSRTLIGSFQLKVIGTTGISKITSSDFLVSFKDGSDSYPCEANELTIILSTDCDVRFETNGGSKTESVSVPYGEKLQRPADPTKEGKIFAGWYKDIDLKTMWNFDTDTVIGNTTLYAKWADIPADTTDDTDDDTTADTGDDTTADTGDDTTADAGDDTTADAGDDTTADAGDNTTADAGDDTTADAGDNTTADTGDDVTPPAGSDNGIALPAVLGVIGGALLLVIILLIILKKKKK